METRCSKPSACKSGEALTDFGSSTANLKLFIVSIDTSYYSEMMIFILLDIKIRLQLPFKNYESSFSEFLMCHRNMLCNWDGRNADIICPQELGRKKSTHNGGVLSRLRMETNYPFTKNNLNLPLHELQKNYSFTSFPP